jgi:FKBP-type peptidyl-prolyl cis-trans isomerase 2
MAKAVQGNTVRVRYQVKLQDGTVCDTSDHQGPLTFTIGDRQVISGLEEAVIGMEPGETRSGRIPRQKAFGEWRSDLQFDLPRSAEWDQLSPAVGQRLEVKQENGSRVPVVVRAVTERSLTLDANHPLAGIDLFYEISLDEIV